jgi:hypothetical protein
VTGPRGGYLLDNRQSEAGERFDALGPLFDAPTIRHIDDLGIPPGRRCGEVGAGGSSVVRRLAVRAGALDLAALEADFWSRGQPGALAPEIGLLACTS